MKPYVGMRRVRPGEVQRVNPDVALARDELEHARDALRAAKVSIGGSLRAVEDALRVLGRR